MDFGHPPEAESFRAELRAWLAANLDERFRAPDAGLAVRLAGRIEQGVWVEEMHRAGAPPAANVQVSGGVGFAFEMDAHLDYRRTRSLLHGDASHPLERLAEAAFAPDPRP